MVLFFKKNILACLCLALALPAHAAKPPTPKVKPLTHLQTGKIGGPAKHGPTIGGPAPKPQ